MPSSMAKAGTRRRSRQRPTWTVPCPLDRSDLVCLKLYDGEPSYFSIAETTTPDGCPLQPAMYRIPCDSLDSSDGGLVQTFDTEGGDFIEDRTPVLESIMRCTGCRAECLAASPAQVSTVLSPSGLVEAVADDMSSSSLPRQRALPVWTAETLHGSWPLSTTSN